MSNLQYSGEFIVEHGTDASGIEGWVHSDLRLDPQDDMFVTNSAMPLVHDAMEHLNGIHNIDSIEDELLAFGAAWHVRVKHGIIDPNGTSYMGATDNYIASIAHTVSNGIRNEDKTINTNWMYNLNITPPTEFDEDLEDIIDQIVDDAISECDSEYDNIPDRDELRLVVLQYLQAGMKKAEDKYPCSRMALNLFTLLCTTIEPLLKHLEGFSERLRFEYAWGDSWDDYGISVYIDRYNYDEDEWEEDSVTHHDSEIIDRAKLNA